MRKTEETAWKTLKRHQRKAKGHYWKDWRTPLEGLRKCYGSLSGSRSMDLGESVERDERVPLAELWSTIVRPEEIMVTIRWIENW